MLKADDLNVTFVGNGDAIPASPARSNTRPMAASREASSCR
jgi:hypothetical protein